MQRCAYFIALAVVGVAIFASVATTAAFWLTLKLPFDALFPLAEMFAHPLPPPLWFFLPAVVRVALFLAFAALIARRLRLLVRIKPVVPPASLTRWPGRLLLWAVISLVLMVLGLLLSAVIRAGSGVPAALLGLPATILLAPVLFYVELRSLSWFSGSQADSSYRS